MWALEEARAESLKCDREKHLNTEDKQTLCMWSDQRNLPEASTGNTHDKQLKAEAKREQEDGGYLIKIIFVDGLN